MAAGAYYGFIFGIETPIGGIGPGIFVDSNGEAYFQIYYGTPGVSVSGGFTNDVQSFMTGTSVSFSLPDGGGR